MLRRVILLIAVLALAAPALAQDEPEVLVDGLSNPRNLAYDAEGNLWIAEAGNGGAQVTSAGDPFGASSQITMVSPDGEVSVEVVGLTSYRTGNALGAHAVEVTDESIWVLIGETSDFRIPFTHALVELDKETGRVKTFVDLLTVELEQDPDGNPNQQSNPTDFAVAPDGTIYIANAGCNCLMSWTAEDGVQVPVVWSFEEDNPVPTTVDVDANGDIYVGFLTGFPWPAGAARVERWSGGELVETYEGLTAVTGVLVTDEGTVYAVEYATGDQFAEPGRVVTVSADGITPVLEGLTFPYGIAQSPDGTIVVSVNSVGGESGQVVVVPGM
jgi:hypothetical protein